MKKNISINPLKILGNIFMTIALLGFAYSLYPLLFAYFPKPIPQIDRTSSILIPKIQAYAPVIKNVDAFDEDEYDQALQHGVAMAKGSSPIGSGGLSYLFAHSSGNPWELTRFNSVFLRLGELNTGDVIQVFSGGEEFEYVVVEKKEVSPSEVSYLVNNDFDGLVLQTCSPIGTDFRRLLIFAKLNN